MDEKGFKKYLENLQLTEKSVKSRLSKGRSIEKQFGLSLDDIVSNERNMNDILTKVSNNDHHGNKQNVLRHYYVFINNKYFPLKQDLITSNIRFHIVPHDDYLTVNDFSKILICLNDSLKYINPNIHLSNSKIKLLSIKEGSFIVEIGTLILVEVVSSLIVNALQRLFEKRFKNRKNIIVRSNDDEIIIILLNSKE